MLVKPSPQALGTGISVERRPQKVWPGSLGTLMFMSRRQSSTATQHGLCSGTATTPNTLTPVKLQLQRQLPWSLQFPSGDCSCRLGSILRTSTTDSLSNHHTCTRLYSGLLRCPNDTTCSGLIISVLNNRCFGYASCLTLLKKLIIHVYAISVKPRRFLAMSKPEFSLRSRIVSDAAPHRSHPSTLSLDALVPLPSSRFP